MKTRRRRLVKKVLKGAGIVIVGGPLLLISLIIILEIVGYAVNHITTDRQTKELKTVILQEIDDAKIIDEYSETGNTSGTGNHVDCLSRISFSSGKDQETIFEILDKRYDYWELKNENGIYIVTLNTSAPFSDNIEGH